MRNTQTTSINWSLGYLFHSRLACCLPFGFSFSFWVGWRWESVLHLVTYFFYPKSFELFKNIYNVIHKGELAAYGAQMRTLL